MVSRQSTVTPGFQQIDLRADELQIRLSIVPSFSAGFQIDALRVHPGLWVKAMICKILFITYQFGI